MYIVPNRNRNTRLTSTPRLEKKKKKTNPNKTIWGLCGVFDSEFALSQLCNLWCVVLICTYDYDI